MSLIYRSIIEPYFTYCCIVWDSISETQIANLQKLQNRAARIITGASYLQKSSDVLCELGWMTLETMRKRQKAILMFKILNGLTPRTCLKCLPIAPLSMIMDCDLPERILRSLKVARIFTETVLHLPEQKSGMFCQTV